MSGFKTVQVPTPLHYVRLYKPLPLALLELPAKASEYTETLLDLTPPEGRNVGMGLFHLELYFYHTPGTDFTPADKAEWKRLVAEIKTRRAAAKGAR